MQHGRLIVRKDLQEKSDEADEPGSERVDSLDPILLSRRLLPFVLHSVHASLENTR